MELRLEKDSCALSLLGRKACDRLTRSEQKRLAIMEAAHEIFMQQGFEAASMDAIAAEASVSKRTVYSHFGSKEELFAAIMHNVCAAKRAEAGVDVDRELPLEEALVKLGTTFLTMLHYHDDTLPLLRNLIGQAECNPQFGEQFMKTGPEDTAQMLAAYFREKIEAGELEIDDPLGAAQNFFSALFGARYLHCLIANAPPPTEEEIKAIAQGFVQRFLYGVVKR